MSSDKLDLQELIVKILSEQTELSHFDCSKDDVLGINEFIHKEAVQYQRDSMGITYVFYYQNAIVGYVTVAMYTIEVKETRLRIVTSEKRYPALLLGRLGVHNEYRGRNIGHSLCLWTIGLAKELSKKVGCRFVVLLTAPSKANFYKKCVIKSKKILERKAQVGET